MQIMTAAEQAVFEGAHRRDFAHFLKVEVKDAGGTYREWSALDGRDYTVALNASKSIAEGYWQGELEFVWLRYNDNLTPFGAVGDRYHDYAAPWREIRISIKVCPISVDPAGFAWHVLIEGRTTRMDIARNPGRIGFIGKIMGEAQNTSFIDKSDSKYGDDGGTIDIEIAMQSLITDWYDPTQTAPTMVVPVASSLQVQEWTQQKMPLLDALRAIAMQIGWALEERWQGSAYGLEFYAPNRSQVTPDFTFAPEQIADYGRFALDPADIRNMVEVIWQDPATPDNASQPNRGRVFRTDATTPAHTRLHDGATVSANSSIAKYGPWFMGLVEGASSLIMTQTAAEALAENALADLADPVLWADLELPFVFWPLELNDLYRFTADGRRSQTDMDLAVQEVSISVSHSGGGKMSLSCKGQPGLPKRMWLAQEGRAGAQFPSTVDPPAAPEVDVFHIDGRGTIVTLREIPLGWNYDQILWHRSADPDFTPSRHTLMRMGRETILYPTDEGGQTHYYKAELRDAQGNITASSSRAAASYQEPLLLNYQLMPLLVSPVQVAAPTLNSAIPLFTDPIGGSQQLFSDSRWCAPEAGAYSISATLTADAEPSSTDLQLELYNVDAAQTVLTGPTIFGATVVAAAAPVVEERTTYNQNNLQTNQDVTMPSTVNAGDLLIVVMGCADYGISSAPSGWSAIANWQQATNTHWTHVYAKKADGTEGGTAPTWTTTTSSRSYCHTFRVRAGTWRDSGTLTDDVTISTEVEGASGTSYDPGSASAPVLGSVNNLFIAFCSTEGGVSQDITGFPSGYSNTSYNNNNSGAIGTGWKLVTAASDDPSAFTGDTSARYHAGTVAVSGAQSDVSPGRVLMLNGSFVANKGDCFELRLGGSGTPGTFDFDGSVSINPIPGTTGLLSRDDPNPAAASRPPAGWIAGFRSLIGTKEVLDMEPRGRQAISGSQYWKGRAGEGEIRVWSTNETVFAGIASPNVATANRATDADDSAFSAVAWDHATGELFGAGHTRDDATTDYAFAIQFDASGTEIDEVTLSTLGTDEEVPTGMRVRSSDQMAWVATKRATGTGRMFRVQLGGGGSIDETGSALDDLLDLVLLEGSTDLVVAVATGDLYAYNADDLTSQQWTIDINATYGETFREDSGEIRESADGAAFYMACGGGWSAADGASTLYKFSRSGALLWSRDVSARTNLDAVDGVGPIAIDASNGDVYVVAVDYNNMNPQWDVLRYDRNGAFLGSMRSTFGFAPDRATNEQLAVNTWPPVAIHRHGASLVAYLRNGRAMTFQVQTSSDFQDPGTALDTTFHELSFAGMVDGETQEWLTLRETSDYPGGDIVLRQATAANRATYRAAGGSLARSCLEFDGTNDYYEAIASLQDQIASASSVLLESALQVFALIEFSGSNPDHAPVFALWSPTLGEDGPLYVLGALDSLVVGDKYGTGLTGQVQVVEAASGALGAAYYFDREDNPSGVQGVPMLIGKGGAREIRGSVEHGIWAFSFPPVNQEALYMEVAADLSFPATSKAWDPPTHWYRCDAAPPTDEGDGTAQNSVSVGTPTLVSTYGSGICNYSYNQIDLDSGDGLTIPHNADMDLGTDEEMTWVFWVEFDAQPTADALIAQKLDANDGWVIYWDHSALAFRLDITWNAGANTLAAYGPVHTAAPSAGAAVCVAFTTGASHAQVWQDGVPGSESTTAFGDATNASDIRICAADANTPAGVATFVGQLDNFGMWNVRQHPFAIWRANRLGASGYSASIRDQSDAVQITDELITIGRSYHEVTTPQYFKGFLYGLWLVGIDGSSLALTQQAHNLLRKYLPDEADGSTPIRLERNDFRFAVCAQSWVWCRFWESSGAVFASDAEFYGPHYAQHDGAAANVSAYQQAPPNILGAGDGSGPGRKEDYSGGYAITLGDTTSVTFPWPSTSIWLETSWSVSWFHKWDTGSAHTEGHVWSFDLSSGYVKCSILANTIRVEFYDGTTTTTEDFATESNPLDGSWHAITVRLVRGSTTCDLYVEHSAGGWYRTLPDVQDVITVSSFGVMSAAEIVFGDAANVPAGEEFEGDLAQVRIAFGSWEHAVAGW